MRRWKSRRKKPVIAANEHASRDGRPTLEGTWRRKDGVGLARLALRQGLVDHRLWHVMKELEDRIEGNVNRTAVAPILLALCFVVAGIRPPLARSFAGLWDHCIDEHD